MTSSNEKDQRRVWFRRLRRGLRRVSRWYAITCAREDARRLGLVVPNRLPAGEYPEERTI